MESANLSRIASLEAELETLRTSLGQKDRFIAMLGHEIRSPMNGVFGMADALSRTDLDEKQRRYLGVLKYACDALLLMANQLLDKGRFEIGQTTLVPVDFDIAEFTANKVEEFSAQADVKGLSIGLESKILANSRIRADQLRLGQVLNNLISNAIRYSDEGRIIVRIFLRSRPDGRLNLVFSVEDSGIGIAPGQHSTIFEAFKTAEPAQMAKRGGTGLGLSLVRDIVELMGGKITLDSALGHGSTFTVELVVDAASREAKFAAPVQRALPKGLKILLAEDNDSNAFVFQVLLEDAGLEITRVRNGEEAVIAATNGQFDLVFMDLQMPVLGGIEATKKIRAIEDSVNTPMPVIALTADSLASRSADYQAAGFSGKLTKPVSQSDLLNELANFAKESG